MDNNTLLEQLVREAGLSQEQARTALGVISDYAKDRFPILKGTIETFVNRELGDAEAGRPADEF
ncbi:MAG TPA: hypothetical protein VHK69_03050 [Chitinophagaceae bacterium]|nr:hypothetical protein [Chitinophagaceae bacterium]